MRLLRTQECGLQCGPRFPRMTTGSLSLKTKYLKWLFVSIVSLNVVTVVLYFGLCVDNVGPNIYFIDEPMEQSNDDDVVIILLWTTFYGHDDFYFGFGHRAFVDQQCPVSNCLLTNNRTLLLKAKAVVFHIRDFSHRDLPLFRLSGQRWIFFLYESPYYTFTNLRPLNNFFNWTVTYRTDSDVPPNITIIDERSSGEVDVGLTKRKLAVWLVSHCWTYSHRETYVEQLRKWIPVDIIGDCGDQPSSGPCSRGNPNATQDECFTHLENNYKFYLSFENSICTDYVTEKFFNVLRYNLVPVVMGGANYTQLAPPNSFVDTAQFQSPQQLAQHLLLLDADDELYNEYLKWKHNYTVGPIVGPWCDLCAKLNDPRQPPKTYEDIERWWARDGICLNSLQLPDKNRSWTLTKYFHYILNLGWTCTTQNT